MKNILILLLAFLSYSASAQTCTTDATTYVNANIGANGSGLITGPKLNLALNKIIAAINCIDPDVTGKPRHMDSLFVKTDSIVYFIGNGLPGSSKRYAYPIATSGGSDSQSIYLVNLPASFKIGITRGNEITLVYTVDSVKIENDSLTVYKYGPIKRTAVSIPGVKDLSFTNANGVSGVITNSTTTPNLTLSLGNITPNVITATGNVTGFNLSGTNTGDNSINSLYSGLSASKQDLLISGTNIRTVNGSTLLGSTNLSVGDALTSNPLSQFSSTTSAQLAGVLSNETGTGVAVFSISPALMTPDLGTPATLVATNATGTATGLTSGASNGLKSASTTVSVSASTAPTTGQALIATSSTSATWQTLSASSVALSSVTAATAANTIDNLYFKQTWNYSTLDTNIGLKIATTAAQTTAATQVLAQFKKENTTTGTKSSTVLEVLNDDANVNSTSIGARFDGRNYGAVYGGAVNGGNIGLIGSGAVRFGLSASNYNSYGGQILEVGGDLTLLPNSTRRVSIWTGSLNTTDFLTTTGANAYVSLEYDLTNVNRIVLGGNRYGYRSTYGAAIQQTSGVLSLGAFLVSGGIKYQLSISDANNNVGIGTTTPNASAKLEVASTTQGVLLPRMTTTQRDAISSPAEGLIIYNLTTHKLNLYTGSSWEAVTSL